MSTATWFFIAALALFVILLAVYRKAGKMVKCAAFTAVSGIGSLGLVWIVGRFLIIPLSITPLTLTVSGVLGIPGVVGMLIFYLI